MRVWLTVGLIAAVLAAAPVPAHANEDAVQFFHDIHVTVGAPLHDTVCFFCSVRDDGTITHDVVVFFGSIYISGAARHDVVSFFGNVRADDNASIGNDLVSIFGNVDLGENVTVGRDAVSIFGFVHAPASVIVRRDRVSIPAILFWGPMAFFILLIVLIVAAIRARHNHWPAPGYPPPLR